MTTLITGGTGFVGQQLVRRLDSCLLTTRDLSRAQKVFGNSTADFIEWSSPRQQPPDLSSVRPLTSVINLMGDPIADGRWNLAKKKSIRESRVIGTRNLVSSLGRLSQKPSVLISASAVGIYGDRNDERLTEDSSKGSGFLADVCHDWEQEAFAAEQHGVRVVVLRIGVVLGKSGGGFPKMATVFRWGLGGTLGNGSQWFPWIHLSDLVSMIIWAATEPSVSGVVNAVAPHSITNKNWTVALANGLDRWAILPAPKFAVRLALGEFADTLFESQNVVPKKALDFGFSFQFDEARKCINDLLAPQMQNAHE